MRQLDRGISSLSSRWDLGRGGRGDCDPGVRGVLLHLIDLGAGERERGGDGSWELGSGLLKIIRIQHRIGSKRDASHDSN